MILCPPVPLKVDNQWKMALMKYMYKDSTISYLLKKWEPCEPYKWQLYFLCLLQGLRCHYCQQNRWNPRGRCRNRMWSLLHWEVRRWVSCNLKAFQNYDTSVHQTKVVSAIVVKVDRCDMYWKKGLYLANIFSGIILYKKGKGLLFYTSCFVIFRYFTFLVECKNPKACTILLRGASKDILNEVERNLQDAMNVTRNVMLEPYLVPGGGAAEMALSQV